MNLAKDTYILNDAQISQYKEAGFICLEQLATKEEIQYYKKCIWQASSKNNEETRALEYRDTYGKAFLQTMNLWEKNNDVKNFVLSKRFAKVAAQLMGVDTVRIYHDQALFKEAGGGHTPWHQDHYYWPLDTNHTITMWMPMVDVDADMGLLKFVPGSHKNGQLLDEKISDESEFAFESYIKSSDSIIQRLPDMRAGDASFHDGWVIHGADANNTSTTREVMTIIYYADPCLVKKPENRYQESDRIKWLNGLEPGNLAASKLNPIVI